MNRAKGSGRERVIDKKEALSRLDGNEEILREATAMFAGLVPELSEKIARACEKRDYTALRDMAHTYKSTAATVGASSLRSIFEELEVECRKEKPHEVTLIVPRVVHELYRFREAAAAGE